GPVERRQAQFPAARDRREDRRHQHDGHVPAQRAAMGGDAALDGRDRSELHDLMRIDQALSIADLQRLARRPLPQGVLDYIEGGAEDEIGTAENLRALARYQLVPRFLTPCATIDLKTTLFGKS